MNQKIRLMALLLCVVMIGAVLGACTNGTTTATATPTQQASTATPGATDSGATPSGSDVGEADKLSLPFEETVVIKYWQVFGSKYANNYSSFEALEYFTYLEEYLNIDFQWTEPSEGSEKEQFGLMIASMDWPDIIQGFHKYYAGGALAGYEDGIIISLNDYITEEYMPNLAYFFSEFPDWKTQATYPGGLQLTLPYFRNDGNLYNNGFMLRKDILDANGWDIPETLGELETMLYNMKDAGVQIPFSLGGGNGGIEKIVNSPSISSAWDLKALEYQDGATHEVKFGAVQPEYKEMLELLNKWYNDGILDPDFITNDSATLNAKIAEGIVGLWYGAGGGNGTTPWDAAVDANIDTEMVVYGIRGVTMNKGDDPKVVDRSDANFNPDSTGVITTQCKNLEEILLAMDWIGYSKEGIDVLMYGVEGEHYVREADGRVNLYVDVDGSAVKISEYDENVTDWKSKWTTTSGPYLSGIINYDTHEVLHQEDTKVAVARWYSPDDTSAATIKSLNGATRRAEWIPNWMNSDYVNNLPQLFYDSDATARRAEYYTEIETYVKENTANFIIGNKSLDEFDSFVDTLYNTLNLQAILDDIQEHVDEYYSR